MYIVECNGVFFGPFNSDRQAETWIGKELSDYIHLARVHPLRYPV